MKAVKKQILIAVISGISVLTISAAGLSCSTSTTYVLEPGDYVVCYTITAALANDNVNTFTIKAQAI